MLESKRLLIVSDRFPPHDRGGSERIAHLHAQGLRARGWDVAVFTSHASAKGARPTIADEDGLKVYRAFPLHPFTPEESPGLVDKTAELSLELWNPWMQRALERVIADFAPRVLHAHFIPRISFGAFAAAGGDLPRALTFHSYHFECPKGGLYRKRGELCLAKPVPCRGFERVMVRALRRVDRVIAISRFIESRMLDAGLPRERVVWLPNGVPLGERAETPPSSSRTILFVGRLEPSKGPVVLVKAFRELDEPSARLRIVGTGSQLEVLRRLAADDARIEFTGWLGRDAITDAYRTSRVVVVPSIYYEGLNTVLCEAAALGRAVVATTLGGNPDLVIDEVTGYLVPPEDPNVLAERIGRLVRDDALADSFGAAGRGHIESFSLERHLNAIEALYAELGSASAA